MSAGARGRGWPHAARSVTWTVVAMVAAASTASAGDRAVDPTELDLVVHALSARDGVACEAVEALTSTPVDALVTVVDTVKMPAYAPMRAADCLVTRHPLDVRAEMERWVVAPELAGLGRLVLGRIDTLPTDLAVPLVRLAIDAGPLPDVAKKKAAAAHAPEIRALVAP